MQTIFIQGLRVASTIGVYPEERFGPQELIVDLQLALPHRRALQSDRLADTIDYGAVAELIRRESLQHAFQLLERLGQHLHDEIQRHYDTPWMRIRISKPDIVPGADGVGVELEFGTRPTAGDSPR